AQLERYLAVRPATAAEVGWLLARAHRRGLDEPVLGPADQLSRPALAGLGGAVFKEGGDRHDPGRPRSHRRYLRVETEAGTAYQSFLVVADMPHRFAFPGGGEWFAAVDRLPFPVDWCARIRPVANAEAQVRAKRQARRLIGQNEEYEAETSGLPSELLEAQEGIDDERATLAANPSDPELETTMLFCVWSGDLVELDERADMVRAAYEVAEYGLPRPTGGQLGCFSAMLPGTALPAVARDYTQFLLPRDLAAGMPFAGAEVGDPRGMLLGVSLDGGTARPVLFDPAFGPAEQRSGSLGAVGDLGSGKSYALKCIAWATLARGGQVVALDRTHRGEWADFARVAPGRPQVVRLVSGAPVCLDPLRVFTGPDRARVAIGFLSLLTATSPTDLEGAALGRAVRTAASSPGSRLADVLGLLGAAAPTDPSADVVHRKLCHLVEEELASLVFGDAPALQLDQADFVVFHTPGLALPDREVLLHEHLAKRMLAEQVLAQALVYLVAAVARALALADAGRFAAVLIDEAWALTASLEGRQLIFEGVRDGRKHNAAMWLVSQHPDDLGDGRIRELLRNRMVFRQSRASARASLEFLGIDASEATVGLVESGLGT
ncbi:MAG: VirB4 family type IV secretion system protein, partial [Acidimicrobiales bacterium]